MAYSMTGYGQHVFQDEWWQLSVRLRSVNHRYCEVSVRMPRQYAVLEDRIKKMIQSVAVRGRVEASIDIEPGEAQDKHILIDWPLAEAYVKALKSVSDRLGVPDRTDTVDLAGFDGIFNPEDAPEDSEQVWEALQPVLEQAVKNLLQMRKTEGGALCQDILDRTKILMEKTDKIEEKAPQVEEEYQNRLEKRLKEKLEDLSVDENRLLTEVALFAEKSSITEEVVRLKSHLSQVEEMLKTGNEIGRKLDFIIQEMNREVNTIGSKTADFEVSEIVISMKAEMEKIREQIQNLV